MPLCRLATSAAAACKTGAIYIDDHLRYDAVETAASSVYTACETSSQPVATAASVKRRSPNRRRWHAVALGCRRETLADILADAAVERTPARAVACYLDAVFAFNIQIDNLKPLRILRLQFTKRIGLVDTPCGGDYLALSRVENGLRQVKSQAPAAACDDDHSLRVKGDTSFVRRHVNYKDISQQACQ